MDEHITPQGVSLLPENWGTDEWSLGDLLLHGEMDRDLKLDAHGARIDPRRKFVNFGVEGIIFILREQADRHNRSRSSVQRLATKVGIARLPEQPGWPQLEATYGRRAREAGQSHDQNAIRLLEMRTPFTFPNHVRGKIAVSLYDEVAARSDRSAEVAGLPQGSLVMMILVLGWLHWMAGNNISSRRWRSSVDTSGIELPCWSWDEWSLWHRGLVALWSCGGPPLYSY